MKQEKLKTKLFFISQNYMFQISVLIQKDIYTRKHLLEGKFISKNLKTEGIF